VAEDTDFTVCEKVIERHEFARQAVMDRRAVFTKESQFWIAIAAIEIAQHLIVSSILFDDVKDMLNRQIEAALTIKQRQGRVHLDRPTGSVSL
jgi:hypothetical protein